ncbi:MAG: caspase family protein [Deltaproteobacteria bacterium]|nr:caspase family protein [Deltaproteobacteria bacterium]
MEINHQRFYFTFIIFLLLSLSSISHAAVVRYAIVVGNNIGIDANGKQPFPPLQHAEREAISLYNRLIELANFDASHKRTILLTGASRDEILKAAATIASQKKADEQLYDKVDSLFAFFFSGHGQSGRLLLQDKPLSTADLVQIFHKINATLQLGVFDACYSGSLDQAALAEKGAKLTPGVNLFNELPQEVLLSEGSIWLVSSGAGEVSYEDSELGGVFMHFFTEALEKAPRDGIGITLDSIWDYTRRNTVAYTADRDRRQIPQQFVTRLKSSGPLYLSFPNNRSSTLILAEELKGRVILEYADGQFFEVIDKQQGDRKEIKIFPGTANVKFIDSKENLIQESFQFNNNSIIILHTPQEHSIIASLGRKSKKLWAKGSYHSLYAREFIPAVTTSIGVEARQGISSRGILLPASSVLASIRLDHTHQFISLALGYGYTKDHFISWSYYLNAISTSIVAGIASDINTSIGAFRFSGGAALNATHMRQEFATGGIRTRYAFGTGIDASVFYVRPQWSLQLSLLAGPIWAPGVEQGSNSSLAIYGNGGLSLRYRL